MKLPAIYFYTGDWLKEPTLRFCTHEVKGVYIDMLCLMHECEERGVLATSGKAWTTEEVARAIGGDYQRTLACVVELVDKGVVSRTSSGAIYSRRMVRDEQKRRKCSDAGKKGGGNPTFKGDLKGHSKGGFKGRPEYETEVENDFGLVPDFSTADVEEIYNAYPLKVEKPAALSEIAKALKHYPKTKILTAVKQYAAATARWPQERKANIHKPVNWFELKKFMDDPKAWEIYAVPAQQAAAPRGIRILNNPRGAQ